MWSRTWQDPPLTAIWSIPSSVHTWFCVSSGAGWPAAVVRVAACGSLLVVPGLGFGRGPAPEPVHRPLRVVPVHPRAGDLLQVGQGGDGPVRNGDPSRVHSVLYSPMVVSARALSQASPTGPTEPASPASISVSANRTEVYTSFAFTAHLIEAGIDASIGTVGDALDNALMESTIGLYKTELIKKEGPWRSLEDPG